MRTCAPWLLKRLGFKPVLTWVAAVATFLLALTAAFRPAWPLPLIYAVLVANGFFQSLQFMAPLLATRLDADAGAELSRHRNRPGR